MQGDLDLSDEQREVGDLVLADAETELGADWLAVLKNRPWTYSGLTIAQLAENYGLTAFHTKIYGIQSNTVHANDALNFIDGRLRCDSPSISLMLGTEGRHLSSLPLIMRLAAGMLLALLGDVNDVLSLELDARLSEFVGRYKAFVESEGDEP